MINLLIIKLIILVISFFPIYYLLIKLCSINKLATSFIFYWFALKELLNKEIYKSGNIESKLDSVSSKGITLLFTIIKFLIPYLIYFLILSLININTFISIFVAALPYIFLRKK